MLGNWIGETNGRDASASSKKLSDHLTQQQSQNPKIHEGHDLNLGFPITEPYHNISEFVEVPSIENSHNNNNNHNSSSNSTSLSALELLRTGITSRGLNSFMPMPIHDSNTTYSSGYAMQDFKPTLNFGVDGLGVSGYGSLQGVQESSGRLLFPFEDLRQVSSTSEFEHNRANGESNGYWSGMLGGGSWIEEECNKPYFYKGNYEEETQDYYSTTTTITSRVPGLAP
ncbi:hypothetical protein IFM89_029702 [Coptis chinensis]|uniref:Uncharacterized protein n=1 Tax=Coptis chinensis TaxID=261450 RepID=A0A835M1R3_9MAGN|nr:hypothetical protein IFM89_029702 [Coptis chinensis]